MERQTTLKTPENSALSITATERKAIVTQILDGYETPGGMVDWPRAYAEHPEWAARLGTDTANKQRSYATLSYLKRARAKAGGKPHSNGSTPAPAAPAANPPDGESERVTIIRALLDGYRRGTRTMFADAWRDHPEWKEKLGATTKSGSSRLYYEVALHRPRTPKAAHRPAADPTPGPTFEFHVMPHCPECGAALIEFFRMYNKMKAQQATKL